MEEVEHHAWLLAWYARTRLRIVSHPNGATRDRINTHDYRLHSEIVGYYNSFYIVWYHPVSYKYCQIYSMCMRIPTRKESVIHVNQ